MTTAGSIIADALTEIGILADGEAPTGDMIDQGLRRLNRILYTQSLFKDFSFTSSPQLTNVLAGQTSFDIGPSGDLVADRPIKIDSAIATLDGLDYEVRIITMDEYDAIPLKTATGSIPDVIAYDGFYPDGNLYLYPVSTGGTIKLRVTSLVQRFANSSDVLQMPEGYEDALMLALAVRSCPSYNRPVSKETAIAAQNAMRVLKRTNRAPVKLGLPSIMTGGSGTNLADIYKG